jgi:hypothetical protein
VAHDAIVVHAVAAGHVGINPPFHALDEFDVVGLAYCLWP